MSINWPDLKLPPINLYSLGKEISPCRKICKLVDGKCIGCLRTADEIAEWTLLDMGDRIKILNRIYYEDKNIFKGNK